MKTDWLGTWWGHLIVQVVVGAASIALQGISGHDFGQYNIAIQLAATQAAELLAKVNPKAGAMAFAVLGVLLLGVMVTIASGGEAFAGAKTLNGPVVTGYVLARALVILALLVTVAAIIVRRDWRFAFRRSHPS